MSTAFRCPRCTRFRWGPDLPPDSAPLPHCYGEGDEPGTPGLIGSGNYCPCECRRWPHQPNELYQVAAKEHPGDLPAIRTRYRDLMVEHGHLVPAKPGDDRNLPCGWPGNRGEART